ncbi:M23 family metallopeptidase [Desulfonatronum thiosulfatophilum]|nr:M23 family metallopeptidase [Desulfonatronum thiosulfatophilum]
MTTLSAWAGIRIESPDHVDVGMPFFLRVFGPENFREITFRWQDKDLTVLAVAGEHGREAVVLLGVCLESPLGVQRIDGTVQKGDQRLPFTHEVHVQPRTFPEQWLQVAREMVSPDQSLHPRIEEERRKVRAALERVTPDRLWETPFVRPVSGNISSEFGLRRFFNDQPRAPHRGVDLRGAEGTLVRAFSNGKVVLTGDHFFAGRSVYIDHGLGVVTQYIHLSEVTVQEGQKIIAGEPIGKVGATGRVTGPHLHFGLSILGFWVDPLALLD